MYTAKETQGNVGESRNFTCPPGTVAVGKKRITCLANGQWETPRCQGLSIIIHFFSRGKGVTLDISISNFISCFLDTCRLWLHRACFCAYRAFIDFLYTIHY